MNREIKKRKLSDCIIDEFKYMLEQNILHEGDKLPDQLTFSKQLGVSRSSLREALQKLEMMGVVKQNPKLGTVIINGNPERWIVEIQAPLYLSANTTLTQELLMARRIIETAVAEIVVSKITDEEIQRLEAIIVKMEEAYSQSNTDELSIYDLDFHIALAKSTKNRYIINMYLDLYNQLGKFIEEAFNYNPLIKENSISWHKKIIKELRKEDKSGLPQLISDHLSSTEKDYYQYNAEREYDI